MGKNILASFQWMVFILAGTIVTPVSIAFAFHFSQQETAELLQRTLFIMGLTSLLQGYFGHKLPLMEGPAGLWWAVFLTYATISGQAASSVHEILISLEFGLLTAGVIVILLSVLNLIKYVKKLFTPTMTGLYLLLLVVQLSGPFIQGILGVEGGQLNGKVAAGAIATLLLAIILSRLNVAFLRNYSVLISLIFGWLLFYLLGISPQPTASDQVVSLPRVLAWGIPHFNLSIFITSVLISLLLVTNLIASMDVVRQVVDPGKKISLNKAGLMMGISQLLAGLFSSVGGVAISGSAGFIKTTRIKERLPFLIGSLLILLMSFFPGLTGLFAAIPPSVGYATLFVSISSIVGLALQTLRPSILEEGKLTVISLAFMTGAGMLLLPGGVLDALPESVSSLLSNGLVIGVVFGIILEQTISHKQ
ncbi:xanthine/uracil permease [Scopulibacillus darangshiensis]|uniref:Xanthine/uracil permease n=1 Tax=Scopulibacillus darangshiensis TaxID=442528 RepID=A0A4R2P4S0_9BACL|nr:purine/pyrimidine permease [Scopulibacillus darangshiensis]TCP29819.1 xanthine/uracil permease [Scopulibacillus darangshiensis]